MNRRNFLKIGAVPGLAAVMPSGNRFGAHQKPVRKPNFLLMLVDDVGYAGVGAFSARINNTTTDKLYYEPPCIDELAKQGTINEQVAL